MNKALCRYRAEKFYSGSKLTRAMQLKEALAAIDWQQPWLHAIRTLGEEISQKIAQTKQPEHAFIAILNEYASALNLANATPYHFLSQHALPKGMAYEMYIYTHGGIPTRPNLHDFFNALIWLCFPRTKIALNHLHAQTILQHGHGLRTRHRDLATLFDENGFILISDDLKIHAALQSANWSALFLQHRDAWSDHIHIFPFGHALLEKLLTPYKAITAHCHVLTAQPYFHASQFVAASIIPPTLIHVDQILAQTLITHLQAQTRFYPLPVMGIPGWCEHSSQTPDFYQDTHVFRPLRS